MGRMVEKGWDLGKCDAITYKGKRCSRWACVGINGRYMCLQHFQQRLRQLNRFARQVVLA